MVGCRGGSGEMSSTSLEYGSNEGFIKHGKESLNFKAGYFVTR